MGSAGSVGVGTGRLNGSQIGKLLTGEVAVNGKIPARIFVDNEYSNAGFTINMSRASQAERAAFLRALRGRSNTDNSQRAYDRVYRETLRRTGSATQALEAARQARTAVTRKVVDGVLKKNPNRFPNIKTNNRKRRS